MWARANRGAGPDSAADDDPSLRAHRRAPRAPRLAARPRHRYAARLGPGDVREGRVDDGIRWAGLSRRRGQRHDGIRPAARRRFHAAGPGCADLRVAPAAEELPTAGGPDRRGSRGAVVRRAGGLAERLESPLPAARRGRAAMTKLVAVSATRRTDEGRERVALNTSYVRALTRAGLVPVIVAPILH